MPFVALGSLNVHYQLTGPSAAPVLLAIHSLGASTHLFDPLAARLEPHLRVLRYDLPGHGLSSPALAEAEASIAALARGAEALLDALSLRRVHAFGISIGGQIALRLAAEAPQRIERLALCSTASRLGSPHIWTERIEAVTRGGLAAVADAVLVRWTTAAFRARAPAEAAGLRALLLGTSPAGYVRACAALRDSDLRAECAGVEAPTLVLAGAEDVAVPAANARELSDSIPGARFEGIAGSGHLPVVEAPDVVATHLREFFAEPAPAAETLAELLERGLEVRSAVLGSEHVARALAAATDLDREFQELITRTAWGSVWARPGLDRRTRSLVTIALLIALGREEELALHLRASRNTGVTRAELAELLLHCSVYAGVPAANAAIRIAKTALSD
jgi:3-oxoadipate enol-lactonase/4-carboxymuconolactone decarboxylase